MENNMVTSKFIGGYAMVAKFKKWICVILYKISNIKGSSKYSAPYKISHILFLII